jgi:NitT/TauT family transport system substrate-binding protein
MLATKKWWLVPRPGTATVFPLEFVRKYPAATKRAVRAIMKANDVCTLEPERVARLLVDKGYTRHYDYAVQALKELPYSKWREYDPEDTVRFYALRLREAGMIKASRRRSSPRALTGGSSRS